jgi:hypothetical protein
MCDEPAHTSEPISNLIELYESWGKPEKAEESQGKLPQEEARKE